MKKPFSILLVAVMAFGTFLAGCSSSQNTGGETTNDTNSTIRMTSPQENTKVNVLSFRFPATEHYADQMKNLSEIDNLDVKIDMKSWDQFQQQSLLILSGKAKSPYHIMYSNDELFNQAKENNWLQPLDEHIEKYWDEYNLGDIPEEVWNSVKHEGKIYGIPFQQNVQHFFYRKDLFEKHNLEVPKTFDDLIEAAEVLREKENMESPLAMNYGKPSGLFTEFHNTLMAYEGKWFDENNRPLFNSQEGVESLKTMKKLFSYMPSSALTSTNDDVMVALQQKQSAMTMIWTSRAAAMDDPEVSQVVGEIDYAPAVSSIEGGIPATQFAQDAFVIPKNIDVDPEVAVQVILEAIDQESMEQAADLAVPVRSSVLTNSAVLEKSRQLPAAKATIDAGAQRIPDKVFINMVIEKLGFYIAEALTDKISPEEALNKAAQEIEKELKAQGHIN